ncbi:MAG: hypothetical protein U0411_14090 [Thermodesulfovibrionales bacterium]
MLIDVSLDNTTLSLPVENPHRLDMNEVMRKIDSFVSVKGVALSGLDVRGLLPRMIRGIAGCEGGCPANALDLVSAGFANFELKYIEGGILSARAVTGDGKQLSIKMFPDF